MCFPHSQLQGECLREGRAVMQIKASIFPFYCKQKTRIHPDKSQTSSPCIAQHMVFLYGGELCSQISSSRPWKTRKMLFLSSPKLRERPSCLS